MRIAFVYDLVYPYSKGGVEKRIWDLAHLLSARGHEVQVLGTHCWDGDADLEVDGIQYRGVGKPQDIHAKGGRRSVWQAVKFAIAAGRALVGLRLDVVEVQGMAPLACLVALAVCKFKRATPVVIWYEVWRGYWNAYLGRLGYLGRLIEWLVAKVAPVNVAVSRSAVSRLAELGVGQVPLLPIGIDYYGIQKVPRSRLGPDVLYVGRLARHKNLGLLIDSLSVLKSGGVEPTVLIVGEGPEREVLGRHAKAEGLANVRFIGHVETHDGVISLMKSSRVFAFPSLREGFGLAPLEAGACGVPVVLATHADNAATELIDDGVNGIVSSGDSVDYARAIGELLGDQRLRDEMGLEAKKRAETYDWTRMVELTERIYSDSLTGSRVIQAGPSATR